MEEKDQELNLNITDLQYLLSSETRFSSFVSFVGPDKPLKTTKLIANLYLPKAP